MGRSSRARRRDPIRHPIPAARTVAATKNSWKPDLTEAGLAGGWPFGDGFLIRPAAVGDLDAIAELVPEAGVKLENEVRTAVEEGTLGAGLRASLRGGKDEFLRHMAETFFAHQGTGRFDQALLHTGLVLVAEHEQHGIVAALIAHPPTHMLSDLAQHAGPQTRSGRDLVLAGAIGMARIRAVVVREQVRRHGVGAAMVRLCRLIYAAAGFFIVYGQMPPRPGLDLFYRSCGLLVQPPGTGLDAWVVTGFNTNIQPGADERIFIWRKP
ncbi:hypothetical protein [Catellatospora sp. NPDC049133]|uniref:hypothetical protein n=1 Tax=Catellatospora sp. NPDC049133 TaxID=3155499 RepID=UPI0033F91DF1